MEAPARVALQTFHQPTNQPTNDTNVLTQCLFISPDLDGYRAPKNGSLTLRDMFHDMFVH